MQRRAAATPKLFALLLQVHLPLSLSISHSLWFSFCVSACLSLPNCEMKIFLPPTCKPSTRGDLNHSGRVECTSTKHCQTEVIWCGVRRHPQASDACVVKQQRTMGHLRQKFAQLKPLASRYVLGRTSKVRLCPAHGRENGKIRRLWKGISSNGIHYSEESPTTGLSAAWPRCRFSWRTVTLPCLCGTLTKIGYFYLLLPSPPHT